jgi:hypothetical protein
MRYDVMAREALRGVVKSALKRVARGGLPGQHHFYITFATKAPGVDVDPELLAKYPEEMTIVLEHQFWELQALDDAFEVTLKFGGAPKYLRVPYAAITRFHDPSVGFALQFGDDAEKARATAPSAAPRLKTPLRTAKSPAPADEAQDGVTRTESPERSDGAVVSLDAFRRK